MIFPFVYSIKNANHRCSNGPYYYDNIIMNQLKEGIGMQHFHQYFGLIFASQNNLTYVCNSLWFELLFETRYVDLFDFYLEKDCSSADIEGEQNQTLTIVDINAKRANQPDHSHSQENYIQTVVKSKSRLIFQDFMNSLTPLKSFFTDFNDSLSLRGPRTVYRFSLLYTEQPNLLPLTSQIKPDFFRESYYRRKAYDIRKGIHRWVAPKHELVITIHKRHGDICRQNEKIAWNRNIHFIQSMFTNNSSVLVGFENYKIYVMSELCHHTNSHDPHRNGSEFQELLDAFPKDKIFLRVNQSEHVRDMEIMASADIFIQAQHSTFPEFIRQHLLKPTGVKVLHHYCTVSHFNKKCGIVWADFNRNICRGNRLEQLVEKCKSIPIEITTEEIKKKQDNEDRFIYEEMNCHWPM